ncbi:MAG: fluoride efflux transporter CrcB [Burkholderiales bacterium]|nr:MAG: fluoride efflux transporter CrcB [Burkholderiales bacterium]
MLTAIAICIGASAGALARWQLGLWLNQPTALLPWGTLAANWSGAWLVGLAVVFFQSQPQLDPAWRLAVITGLLGALTTFSTFSVEVVAMLQQGRVLLAAGNAALHLFGSLALTLLGMKMAGFWWPRVV